MTPPGAAPSTGSGAASNTASATLPSAASATPLSEPPDAIPRALVDALGAENVRQVEHAITAITRLPAGEADPDLLFAAGRACEDRLLDPAHAVAIYERVVAEHPGARVATAAAHRIAVLRGLVGPHG
ncbi:MAG TPA: hypothetical protein VLK58_19465, partial [Conexibacter sp.]|nr:hypothetical protein [Conexibacter sp.]